jgi:hypothetical protein
VEIVFGILSSRFGVFQKPIPLEPEKVVLASCVLHNFLRTNTSSKNIYTPPVFIDREINGTVVEAEWCVQKFMESLQDTRCISENPSGTTKVNNKYGNYTN